MAIVLIRHGQTDWNLERRLQSRTDVPLNVTGRRQAGSVRDALAAQDIRPLRTWSSPLNRALTTARIVHGGEPVVDERLIELHLGRYEGRLEADLRAESGDRYDRWRALRFTEAAPGGESIVQAMERVRPLIAELADHAREGPVLVVGHQFINTAIKAVLSGRADIDSLAGFAQDNDEIDVWEADGRHRERIRAAEAGGGPGGSGQGRDRDRVAATRT
jgi:probable phosphoglycerate mutase